jgi:hypothetical protein
MASTQPVYLRTAEDLTRVTLRAGDDAVAARVANTREMGEGTLGIPDQLGMIAEIPD